MKKLKVGFPFTMGVGGIAYRYTRNFEEVKVAVYRKAKYVTIFSSKGPLFLKATICQRNKSSP